MSRCSVPGGLIGGACTGLAPVLRRRALESLNHAPITGADADGSQSPPVHDKMLALALVEC